MAMRTDSSEIRVRTTTVKYIVGAVVAVVVIAILVMLYTGLADPLLGL